LLIELFFCRPKSESGLIDGSHYLSLLPFCPGLSPSFPLESFFQDSKSARKNVELSNNGSFNTVSSSSLLSLRLLSAGASICLNYLLKIDLPPLLRSYKSLSLSNKQEFKTKFLSGLHSFPLLTSFYSSNFNQLSEKSLEEKSLPEEDTRYEISKV
jgi:hypothetical protein